MCLGASGGAASSTVSKQPLHAAILAANPHDTQPWLFELRDEAITVYADRARNLGAFDPFRREMHLGLGAAIENLVRAAGVDGYTAYVRPVAGRLKISPGPEPVAVAHITMDPGAPARDPLFEAIPDRHTNRGVYLEKPLADECAARACRSRVKQRCARRLHRRSKSARRDGRSDRRSDAADHR